jgi:sugar phosphate isomerase/epimerase
MQLSITSDYVRDEGDPEPYLRRIADAGFTHIHWCHHWRSDFLYADSEIEQLRTWFDEYGLTLNDVHGSEGVEKFWYSPKEYARLAGIELVKNRIDFTARLGADAVVMHVYPDTVAPEYAPFNAVAWDQLRRSLDELEPYARERGVRIAVENLIDSLALNAHVVTMDEVGDNFAKIGRLFDLYSPDYLGLCYDSGHANLGRDRMDDLEPLTDRLIALHLHDNNGMADQHRLIFSDVIDWERLAGLIAQSAYHKPISMEVSMKNAHIETEEEFLRQAYETGERFTHMVEQQRS